MTSTDKLLRILTSEEKRRFARLGFVILLMAIFEVIGVVSILPFIQLIADPGIVDRNEIAHEIYVYFEFRNVRQLMLTAGAMVVFLLILTNSFSVYKTWLQHRTAWSASHNLSMRLLGRYLSRPYEYFLSRNTAQFMSYIKVEATRLTTGVIMPALEAISRLLVALIILILLILIDPEVAVLMFSTLGLAYGIIFLLQRKVLRKIGERNIEYSVKRYVSLQELFDGIKTVQVFDRQEFFSERYRDASEKFTDLQPVFNVLVTAPKAVMETLAFGAIVGVTIYLYLTVGDIVNIVPRLSLYAVAGYRLLPSLQKAFASIGKFIHSYPVVDKLYESLYADIPHNLGADAGAKKGEAQGMGPDDAAGVPRRTVERLPFLDSIELNQTTFSYRNNKAATLKGITLKINKGETVAFVGATGSGKTTLVDILVGLLAPQRGPVVIDGKRLTQRTLHQWRASIAYVPQDVFLFDDTVARNITLKEDLTPQEQTRLEEAARMADIHEFINSEMAEGYQTAVGEKGVRLSGGQRQRLGLARAFFHRPTVLLLDEATSALDNITERGILDALDRLPEEITTIVIAHRLSTVRHADQIFLINNGRITAHGTYDELMDHSGEFQEMARTT